MEPTEDCVDARDMVVVGVSGTDNNSWPEDSLPDCGPVLEDRRVILDLGAI